MARVGARILLENQLSVDAGPSVAPRRQLKGIAMNTTYDISDEDLEIAAGMSDAAQAGSSLYSTVQASGCTC